ncbi:hypothetical protein AAEH95_09110 [Shewanella xiamenensis]|uniref:hypothetical protein n=1 Tax=Shewanella xiamenensis TaxID=332186 RepID=UPI00313D60AA
MFDEECLICCFYGAANYSAHSHDLDSQLSDKNPIELEAKINLLKAKQLKLQADEAVGIKRELLLAQSNHAFLRSREILNLHNSSLLPEQVANEIYGTDKSEQPQSLTEICSLRVLQAYLQKHQGDKQFCQGLHAILLSLNKAL